MISALTDNFPSSKVIRLVAELRPIIESFMNISPTDIDPPVSFIKTSVAPNV
jgi:hypothetical protein